MRHAAPRTLLAPLLLAALLLAACASAGPPPPPPVAAPNAQAPAAAGAPAVVAAVHAGGTCSDAQVAAALGRFLERLGNGGDAAAGVWGDPDPALAVTFGYLRVMTPGGVEAVALDRAELPTALGRMARGTDGAYALDFVEWRRPADGAPGRALAALQWSRAISMRGSRYRLRGDATALVACGDARVLFLHGAEGGTLAADASWCGAAGGTRMRVGASTPVVCAGPGTAT